MAALGLTPTRAVDAEDVGDLQGRPLHERRLRSGQDLQGTDHLAQNFAKAFDLKFQTESGEWQHAYNTSWGASTRLVGAIVMCHADDNGLVLPPRLAPVQGRGPACRSLIRAG